jgi:hypothetical protein
MNLTAIQTVAIVAQTLVFGLQTGVLIQTLSAVKKQAAASDAQAIAAHNQAEMAVKQMYANIAQADQTVRPLISVRELARGSDSNLELLLNNDGLGPAFQINAFFEEKVFEDGRLAAPRRNFTLLATSLGVGGETKLVASERILAVQDLVIEYESAMHSMYETRYVSSSDYHNHQSQGLKRQPYASLVDVRFRSLLNGDASSSS